MVPTLLILSALVFLSVRFIPGDIIDALESRMDYLAAPLDREQLERVLGLDAPIHVQYVRWVGDILVRGTLGDSLLGKDTVEAKIWLRVGPTFQLGLMALVIAMVIALPVGIFSAIRQDTAGDYAGRTVAVLGLATPNFWLALMVIIYPALWWDWSPPIILVRFLDDPWESMGVFIIPSIILGTALSAGTMRITRTMMLEVLRQDYVRTAWAKGLRERMVVLRHAIKNAMIPVLSAIGLAVPLLVGGSVIIENIFNLPGMGQMMFGGAAGSRLPGRFRGEPVLRHRRAGHQPPHRSALRLPGPAGAVPVVGARHE